MAAQSRLPQLEHARSGRGSGRLSAGEQDHDRARTDLARLTAGYLKL